MKSKSAKILITIIVLVVFASVSSVAQEDKVENPNSNKCAILWTSGDREVAEKVVFMYVYNAKKYGWWEDVSFIVWGPSAKLLAEDAELQKEIGKMLDLGIKVEACVVCARMYGVDEKLASMGIEVKGMGAPLTEYIKSGWHTLTF